MSIQNSSNYHPEPYWSEVAERIDNRDGRNVIAGDDEPYYRYKRTRFLEMLKTLDFNNKNAPSVFLQNITLLITKILDKIFKSKRNIGKLVFKRTQ